MENTQNKQHTILLSAGGTGGHLFPAQALATEILKHGNRIILATDSRGLAFHEKSAWAQKSSIDVKVLPSATMGSGLLGKITALFTMGMGILKALLLIKKTKPDCVVGFGGYPSFPAVFAAQLLHVPTILHEQNAVLGKANARLAKKAKKIAISLPDTEGVMHFVRKTILVGNPVRADILAQQGAALPAFDDNDTLNIFVMGGSQGARIFGEVIPAAIKSLPGDLQHRISIREQCRPEEIDTVLKRFEETNASADIRPFFNDVAKQLVRCHVFIGRSGASTVAEVAVVGRPALFVPLKHSDGQQRRNAEAIAEAGGAWVMEDENFTPQALGELLKEFFEKPDMLLKAAEAAKSCGKPGATGRLARLVYDIGGGGGGQNASLHKDQEKEKDLAA